MVSTLLKIRHIFLFVLFVLILFYSQPLHASNYKWTQTDWYGGADTSAVAGHPADQLGWTKLYSKDSYVNNSIPGQITIAPVNNSWTQTSDIQDFDMGVLSNLKIVGNGQYVTTRHENNSSSVTTTGTWTTSTFNSPSGGSYIYSNTLNSTATLSFTGTNVSWIGYKRNTYGIAGIYIDNVFQGNVDCYNSTLLGGQVLWSISTLSNTAHTIKIVVTGTKNPSSQNTFVSVDAFDITSPNPDTGAYITFIDNRTTWTQTADLLDFDRGVLSNLKIVGNGQYVTTRYENDSSSVTTTGTWTTSTFNSPSGGSYIYSNTLNSTATLSFTGTSVSWIGYKRNTYGIAGIYIDNVFQGNVDCYNSTLLGGQVLWSISTLSNTAHTIKIVVTGTKNPSSQGTFVSVDAFDVVAANPDPAAYLMLVDGVTSGTYDSTTLDTGAGGSAFFNITWNAVVPAGSNLRIQIASNNNNSTWNFTGPDGTANTYYETSGVNIYSGHTGSRYIKYRVFFNRLTTIPADSPVLNDVTIAYGLLSFLHGTYVSPSFNVGSIGAFYWSIAWNAAIPAGASLKFQIATNDDNATWNFIGPDGTPATYYVTSGEAIFTGHNGNKNIKYKVFFDRPTLLLTDTPLLNDVTITYGLNSPLQSLVSSPYDTIDSTNIVRRLMWSESLPGGTDIVLQLRTSPDGVTWTQWYGPDSSTFSSGSGVSQITVASVSGFSAGSRVILTNSANVNQVEIKKITAINSVTNAITLDSSTGYVYSSNSIVTDTFTAPAGTEPINNLHRTGNDDRWFQYRVILFTIYGTVTPALFDDTIGYFPAAGVYQPDGIIDGNGDNVYGTPGTGTGGSSAKNADPGFKLLSPLTYDMVLQNEGSVESIDDTLNISWNIPTDVSGSWTVNLIDLNDPNNPSDDVTYASSPVSAGPVNVGAQKLFTLKVIPSANAPADSTQDILVEVHSENDYIKADSLKASVHVNRVFKTDGLIDGNGNDVYDSVIGGLGGKSALKEAFPGDTLQYTITLQNEGNIADTFKLSLLKSPPAGWTVLLNDGTKDFDITNPSNAYNSVSIRPLPYSDYTRTYTLKVIPKGAPVTEDLILNIYSNSGLINLDSVTASVKLNGKYMVDGLINSYTVSGGGCGGIGAGDNVYGILGSGNGGCTGIDIPASVTKDITILVQNEGNLPDSYQINWNTPSGWGVVMQEKRNDGVVVEYNMPPFNIPTPLAGNPSNYNPGEVPYFTFRITPPSSFISGSPSQTIVFDIKSIGDSSNSINDSVKVVVNSMDTTPPASVTLNPGSISARSLIISWTAPGDDGMNGTASSYDLRYSATPITTDTDFNSAGKIKTCKTGESNPGKPKTSGSSESCTISGLFANTDYYIALKSTDDAGNTSAVSTCSACPAHTLVSGDVIPPGVVTDLSVTGSSKDTVTLCWTAKADDGSDISSDVVTAYELRYSKRNIVDDGITPGVGEVAFSTATPVIPSGGFLPPKAMGMKECYIVPVENKINLGGGIFEDRTNNTRFYFAVKGLDEAGNMSSISNVAGGMTALIPNAYNMVSVPYNPVPDTPVDVFGDDAGSQLYVYNWDSRGPNWNNGCFNGWPLPNNAGSEVCTQLTTVSPGKGYFLWTPPGSISLDVPAASTVPVSQDCTDDILPLPSHFQCYAMTLQNGWNMIGNPFDKEINISARDIGGNIERGLYIRKTTGTTVEVAGLQDAVTDLAKMWIDGSVYAFNGTTYTYETCSQDGTGEPLGTQCGINFQPWKAYWIRLHGGGSSTYELLIPN